MDFADPADHRVKIKESEKVDKYLDVAIKWKKTTTAEYEVDGAFGTVLKDLEERLETREESTLQKHSIVIGQNTEKSPDDLRRLNVSQTPLKNQRIELMWKTQKEKNNNSCLLCQCLKRECHWQKLKILLRS